MSMITPDDLAEKLRWISIVNEGDASMTHIFADGALCDTLVQLGYGEAVKIFRALDIWYS